MAGRVAELIWKSDNRSVIRDLKQIADQSESTGKQIKRDADDTSASYDKVRRSTGLLRDSVSSLAGMVGFGGLAFGLKDAIQGGIQLQAAQAQLRTALGGSKTAFQQLNDVAEKASTHGGFGTAQNITSLTALVRETHSASEATKLFGLATDIARGRNMDLASAQTIVQRAYTGSVGRLQQLLGPMVAAKSASYGLTQAHKAEIIQLELQSKSMGKLGPQWLKQQELLDGITPKMKALATLQDKSATAQQVIAAAETAFGGATAAFSNTTAGRMSNLQNSLKNLADTTGEKLLPVVNLLARYGTVAASALGRIPAPMLAAVVGLTGLGAAVGVLRGAFGNLKAVLGLFGGEVSAAGGKAATAGSEEAVAGEEALAGAGGGAAGFGTRLAKLGGVALSAAALNATIAAATGKGGGSGTTGIANRYLSGLTFGAVSPSQVHKAAGHSWFGGAVEAIPGLGPVLNGLHLGLARGGVVPRYLAGGGPMGTDTVPAYLTPGEGVLSLQGMRALGNLNAGGTGAPQIIEIRPQLRVDGRVLAETVTRYALNRAARGPTSLVGGSLVTGAPGLPA